MSTELVTVEQTATVAEAATVMGARQVGSALVLDGGAPAGIFTERDVLRALAAHFDAARHPVTHWMTRDPVTIDADAPIEDARSVMLERGFRHLLVTDGDSPLGVVSMRDLLRATPS